MSFLLAVSRVYIPGYIRKRRLNELFKVTADAFQQPIPRLNGYSIDQYLTEYALFTRVNAQESIKHGIENEVKERLHCNAHQIGQNIREKFKIQNMEELMQACAIIYKALKIDLHGDFTGHINIKRCFFSSFYSSDVCRVISSLDEGLVSGLSGGLRLEFHKRITEGNRYCEAYIRPARI